MSRIQRLFHAVLPRGLFTSMEAESRTWMTTCGAGHRFSIWDAGGIRWKAMGNPTKLLCCPVCGTIGPSRVIRETPS
jgi:hypothetical protein